MKITRCLVVEDHEQARAWITSSLNAAFPDAVVVPAGTLAQAQTLLENEYDLAILDIGLPDGNGIDLVAPLVEKGCEVVISSIFADDEHLLDALKQGAKGYVLKDHDQKEVVAMLKGILDGQPPLSPSIARRVLDHFMGKSDNPKTAESAQPEDDHGLTTRERDVLTLLAKGYTVKAVADLLEISHHTAAGYAKSIYRKLNVSSRAEATMEANRMGYVE